VRTLSIGGKIMKKLALALLATSGTRKGELTMKKWIVPAAVFACAALAGTITALGAKDEPVWAWGFTTSPPSSPPPPAPPAAPLDKITKLNLPGSKFSFARAEISNPYGPADWFPEDHPTRPDIVAHGRETAHPRYVAWWGVV
jgi:hypothetical protein